MINDSPKRYRISVPLDDAIVIEWMNCQHSLSLSLRQLVKAAIEVNGMRDYFASSTGEIIQKSRRGRPPKVIAETSNENNGTKSLKFSKAQETPLHDAANESVSDRIRAMQGLLNK